MYVLTPENLPFNMNSVAGYVPEQMYCVLDLSDLGDSDYYFHHIEYVVSFSSMLVELCVGDHRIEVPMNTQILIGDEDTGMMEMCAVEDILTITEPCAYALNPLKSLYPRYLPLKINRVFSSGNKWQMPMLKKQNLLVVPFENKSEPLCIFLADEHEKIPDFFLGE